MTAASCNENLAASSLTRACSCLPPSHAGGSHGDGGSGHGGGRRISGAGDGVRGGGGFLPSPRSRARSPSPSSPALVSLLPLSCHRRPISSRTSCRRPRAVEMRQCSTRAARSLARARGAPPPRSSSVALLSEHRLPLPLGAAAAP